MRRFLEFRIPNGDRDWDDDDDLINNGPVEVEELKNGLPPKEEAKNLVIKVLANNQEKGKHIKIDPIPIPRAFDLEYYQNKIDHANFHNDKDAAIKAVAIKKYVDIAYEFYRHIMYTFNKKHDLLDMPEYIRLCEKAPCNVDNLAKTMYEREQTLIKYFNGSDNVISAFSKRKHLSELKRFSAQAWMMYFSLKSFNDFVGYLRFIESCNRKADLNNKSHVANMYGLHMQTSYYLDANIKNFFSVKDKGYFSKKCPQTAGMYKDLNSIEEFNIILKEKDAYIFAENHEKITKATEKIKSNTANNMKDKPIEERVIGFYKYYKDMKYIKHRLLQMSNYYKDKEFIVENHSFQDVLYPIEKYRTRNIYKVGYKYYIACEDLVKNLPVKSKIYRDVCDMCVELEEALVLNQDNFKLWQDNEIRIHNQFKEAHPNFIKMAENRKSQEDDYTIKYD